MNTPQIDMELDTVNPSLPETYKARLVAELEAATALAEAESLLNTLESQPVVKRYKNSQIVANAHGIGQCIFEWRQWVESMNKIKTPNSNPGYRLQANFKTLPEGCIFDEAEVEEVRQWILAKRNVTTAQTIFDAANNDRNFLLKEAARSHNIAAKQYTEVAL